MPNIRFKALYEQIQQENAPAKNEPVPDLTSVDTTPDVLYDYIVRSNQAKYKETRLALETARLLNSYSDQQLRDLYNKCKGPNINPQFTEGEFINKVRAGQFTNALSPMLWGHRQIGPLLDAYDEMLADKEAELGEIQESLRGEAPLPDAPGYKGKTDNEPFKQDIEDARNALNDPNDPQKTAQVNELLNEAQECLKVVDPVARHYFDTYDSETGQYAGPGMQHAQELMKGVMVREGLNTFGNGKYKDYLVPLNTNGGIQYIGNDDHYWPKDKPFTDDARNDLAAEKVSLSDGTVNAVVNMTNTMDSLEYRNYVKQQKNIRVKHLDADNAKYYLGEHGTKYYAFWPLIRAKQALADAVKSKNIDEIRRCTEEYKQIDAKIQSMVDETKKEGVSHAKYFSGNVNSTRDDTVMMPSKYVFDFPGHNKVNTIYALYGFSKNTGIPVQDIVKDPANSLKRFAENLEEKNGINSRNENIGSTLAWGLQPLGEDFRMEYINSINQLSRGLEGVLALEADPKKRNEFAAAAELAKYNATLTLDKDAKLIQSVERIVRDAEKIDCIYCHAAVQPHDEFDLKKMIVSMNDPDASKWRTDYNISDQLTPGKLAQYDYGELKTRPQTVLRQFEEARQKDRSFDSKFNRNRFLLSSFNTYCRMIKNAPAEVRENPDFVEFKKNVMNMYELTDDPETKAKLRTASLTFGQSNPLFNLHRGKEDRFWGSKRDTLEYTTMKDSILSVSNEIKHIRGDGAQTGPAYGTGTVSFRDKLNKAKDDTFNYIRLKRDNGKKTKFSEQSGEDRFTEALSAYNEINRVQRVNGLISPAQDLFETARMELLMNRKNEQWMRENAAKKVATMIYAKSIVDAKIPDQYQKDVLLRPDVLEQEVRGLQTEDAARSFIQGPPQDKMIDLVFDNAPRFKAVVETYSTGIKNRYKPIQSAERFNNAVVNFKRKYALGKAMQDMGIEVADDSRCSTKNKELQDKADEIEKDPDFNERLEFVMKGKSKDEILSYGDKDLPNAIDPVPGFKSVEKAMDLRNKFVQRMTEEFVKAQNPNKYKNGEKPRVSKIMLNLYQRDEGVNNYIRKITQGKDTKQIDSMIKDLDDNDKIRGMILEFNKTNLQHKQKGQHAGVQLQAGHQNNVGENVNGPFA